MDKVIEKKKGLRPKHIIWIVGGLAFAFLLYKVIFSDYTSTFRADKDKLTISTVESSEFNDYITAIGQVEPITTIYLDVEEGGKVEEIFIEEGEMVTKGDVILRLKNDDLKTSIMNSESNMAYHSNELRNTQIAIEQQQINNRRSKLQIDMIVVQSKRKYNQYESLFNEDLIAKEEYLRAKEDYELSLKEKDLTYQKFITDSVFRSNQKANMDENLANMGLNLVMAKRRLENLNVKAPENGQ
ncbi:MAG: biotin/lipoyl-binding protein, partial [Gammaproteobacteria bacterium]|nr:biotin/lipoyl-binding protein [Gammaproteobacteria bacterium]